MPRPRGRRCRQHRSCASSARGRCSVLPSYAGKARNPETPSPHPRSALLELELANRFEVSQGTVREALLLLQEEGLVHRAIARQGKGLADALRHHLGAMQDAAAAGDEYLLSVHDRAFHAGLFEQADLPPVQPVLARCLIHAHRFKILHPEQQRDLLETANRHQVIIQAVAAVDALSHHITTIVDFGPSVLVSGA
ncbi:GntR family transcriptional regulator [Tabrizicola sp. WMC-M-20]|nr:GntR family transcriptional regulator [Tabrizicola sp. WMC-M-20]